MPIVQIDWESVKALFADATQIVAITSRQRALLLSLSQQLDWRKTFDAFGYDWSDEDDLDAEIADLQRTLTMPVNLSDIIPLIDDIESLLTALVNQAGCCGPADPTGGDWYTDDVVDGVGDVPQNIIDAGYATDASDWEGFYDYKCMICHLWVSQVEQDLRDLAPYVSNGVFIIGGIAVILSAIATLATGGTILAIEILAGAATAAELAAGLLALADSGTEALADKIGADHDDLVCALYQADGAEDMFNIWMSLAATYNAVEMIILRNMNVSARIKALYAGRYDQQDIAAKMAEKGLDPADYDCTCEATLTDMDIYGIRWQSTFNNSADKNDYFDVVYAYVSNSINNSANYTLEPYTGGVAELHVFGPTGQENLSAGEPDVVTTASGDWQEDERYFRYLLKKVNAQGASYSGRIENFQCLVSDGQGSYEWLDADITITCSTTCTYVSIDSAGASYSRSYHTGTWTMTLDITINGVWVP